MKKLIITVAIIVVLIGAAAWVVFSRGKNGTDPALAPKIEVVKRGNFQMTIRATGNLEPLLDVEVKSNVEGEVIELLIDDGSTVQKGDILVRLDPELYKEEQKQAKADVDAAEAQLMQAKLNIELKKERLNSDKTQREAAVKIANANLETTKAESLTRISSAETDIQSTKNLLEQDNIAVEQAKISLEQAKLSLAEYETSLNSSKVSLDTAKSDLERNKSLFEQELVSKQVLEDSESRHANSNTQYENAKKRVESQKQTLVSQERTIVARQTAIKTREAQLQYQKLNLQHLKKTRAKAEEESQIRLDNSQTQLQELLLTINNEKLLTEQSRVSADANLLRRESSLKNQDERLAWTVITAPMSGTVTQLAIEEGEIVTSGRSAFSQSPPIMTIADLSKMVVKTFINEVDMERLENGQPAEIKIDAFQTQKYDGRVYEISPSGQQQDNIISFEVMIEVLDSSGRIKPGMSADVDIITYEEKNVLMLPLDAVISKTSATAVAQVGNTSPFKVGKPVAMQTLSEKIFNGTVQNVANGSVTIELDSSQRGIIPGPSTVSLLINGDNKADGVQAQVSVVRGKFVMLDNGSDKGVETQIETGMQNETNVIVKSGIAEGDRVILQRRQRPQMGWGR
ncbi:MAG: HlyD family efflux transporter periplasmic adaptor subunit [Candidatus Poribacteria bacterium]|nr:HlyD family efflux transporter periplasmic adaptor subunit [Candidatus Poribacteria bacterium]